MCLRHRHFLPEKYTKIVITSLKFEERVISSNGFPKVSMMPVMEKIIESSCFLMNSHHTTSPNENILHKDDLGISWKVECHSGSQDTRGSSSVSLHRMHQFVRRGVVCLK